MRIGHCQLDSVCGDFSGNLNKVVSGLERADAERVEIVCFPECFLTGYSDSGDVSRQNGFAVDSSRMMELLDRTSRAQATLIVGFNEIRGDDLYNTAAVIHKGHLLGTYSKCSAYMPFHKQGRDFPVFEHNGVRFGVIICSDGGYIEPTRILAMKGAKIIFAPHYNYIGPKGLIEHFMHVRADHTARAVENRVYFVRGNNVTPGKETGILKYEGVGYGDSYVVDPQGEILVRSRRHQEDFIWCDVDPDSAGERRSWGLSRSAWSHREFGALLAEAAKTPGPGAAPGK